MTSRTPYIIAFGFSSVFLECLVLASITDNNFYLLPVASFLFLYISTLFLGRIIDLVHS